MNSDILIEKIKYLSSLPHSSLVEHCIYLENENDNYKAQKYITNFISENGIICEKDKEIERLSKEVDMWNRKYNEQIDIIKELEETLEYDKNDYGENIDIETHNIDSEFLRGNAWEADYILDKLKELKENNK